MNNKSYSRYRNINSPIHKIDPITKLLSFILIITSIFLSQSIETLVVMFLFVIVISFVSRIKISSYFKTLFFIIPFFISMTLIYRIFYSWENSIILTSQMSLRLYIFIILSIIYTSSTKEMEIANSIEWIIKPLRLIKVPTYEISMMIMLAIRFIPLIISDLNKILIAQSSRGINSINGTPRERGRAVRNSLLPMFILAFKRADDISISMTIRGYKIGKKRTKFIKNKFMFLEFISILLSIGILIIIILINNGTIYMGLF